MIRPIYLSLERSRALDEPLTTETGTTTEDDLEDLMNYVGYEWAKALTGMVSGEDLKFWQKEEEKYGRLTGMTILAHPPPPQTPPRGLKVIRI